jgi:hypothetical protein
MKVGAPIGRELNHSLTVFCNHNLGENAYRQDSHRAAYRGTERWRHAGVSLAYWKP